MSSRTHLPLSERSERFGGDGRAQAAGRARPRGGIAWLRCLAFLVSFLGLLFSPRFATAFSIVTEPDGDTTRYAYDPLGALVGVEHAGHRVLLQRDVLGREIRKHVYKGQVDIQSAYDAMDRLVDRRVSAPAPAGAAAIQVLSERRYAYDAAGRLRGTEDTRWGATAYEYDAIGQLIEAQRGAHREVFEYDVTGSLQNVLGDLAEVGRAAPWTVGQGNVLTERPGVRYENDEQRRRTKAIETRPDGTEETTEYIWDCRDRLREIKKPSGERLVYTYDAFARRVRKEVVPAARQDKLAMVRLAIERGKEALPKVRVTEYLWDGDALAAEIDAERGQRTFVDEPGTLVPLLQAEQGEVFTVVNDHLGMPKELVDQDGRNAWSAAHSAWGKVEETWRDPLSGRGRRERAVESPFRLLGQYEDGDAGLCYTRYRWFDAGTGRWCSPDPLGIAGGTNLLALNGSPTGVVDPLGLCGQPAPAEGISNDAFVVRGGVATPEQIAKGIGEHRDVPGLVGFSAQSREGASVEQLAATGGVGGVPFPHGQVSVTTVGQLRAIGAQVVPSPGGGANHVTVVPGSATPAQIASQFAPQPNPGKPR